MTFIKLSDVLKDKLNQSSGLKRQVGALNVIDLAKKFLNEEHQTGIKKLDILSFKDGVLKVVSTSSIAAAELKMQENRFINYLNKALKGTIVKKIFIVLQ